MGGQERGGGRPLSPCLAGAVGVRGLQGSRLCVLGAAAIPEQRSRTRSHTILMLPSPPKHPPDLPIACSIGRWDTPWKASLLNTGGEYWIRRNPPPKFLRAGFI